MNEASEPPAPLARVKPFCKHLLSKNIVKRTKVMLEDDDVLDASRHCWCKLTGQTLGPDRFSAHPSECRVGRACFESPFASWLR